LFQIESPPPFFFFSPPRARARIGAKWTLPFFFFLPALSDPPGPFPLWWTGQRCSRGNFPSLFLPFFILDNGGMIGENNRQILSPPLLHNLRQRGIKPPFFFLLQRMKKVRIAATLFLVPSLSFLFLRRPFALMQRPAADSGSSPPFPSFPFFFFFPPSFLRSPQRTLRGEASLVSSPFFFSLPLPGDGSWIEKITHVRRLPFLFFFFPFSSFLGS